MRPRKLISFTLLALASLSGCRRYVASRELAPIPPVDDSPIRIDVTGPGTGTTRLLDKVEQWLGKVEPELGWRAEGKLSDSEQARMRLEASRNLHLSLRLIAPDAEGTRALELAFRIAAVEHLAGADGASEIGIGLGEQLLARRKTLATRLTLARLYNDRFRFEDAIGALESEAPRAKGGERADTLWLLATARKQAGRTREALVTAKELATLATSGRAQSQAKALLDELEQQVAAGAPVAPASAPARDFAVEVAGARATYQNTRWKWSVRYPVDWMVSGHLPNAARFVGSYLGVVIPVSEGPTQAAMIVYQVKLAEGEDPVKQLEPAIARSIGGAKPQATKQKSPGKLDLAGEVAYYLGETSDDGERLRYEAWITRGTAGAYGVIVLSPVARWFEIREEVTEVLESLQLP